MNRTFVISDTHFGHKRIIEFEPELRPFKTIEEHDEELVYRWNNAVKAGDTVWHLGDVLFGVGSFDTLMRLRGKKILIMGNHDHHHASKYLNHFDKVLGTTMIRGCLDRKSTRLNSSHIPLSRMPSSA